MDEIRLKITDKNEIIRLFRIYRHLTLGYKDEFNLLLTPENMFNVSVVVTEELDSLYVRYINSIKNISIIELIQKLEHVELNYYEHRIINNFIKHFLIYISLRPQILEEYIEYSF